MRTRLILAAVAFASLASWCGWRQVSAADGPNFATWEGYGGGADNSQFTTLKQIDKTNVKQLEQVWTYPAASGATFSPVIVDGTMFVLRPAKDGVPQAIVALNAATGKELWAHPVQGAIPARGINYWESKDRKDRRLVFPNAGFIIAINAQTGETILSFGDNGRVDMKVGVDRDPATLRNVQSSNPGHIAGDKFIASLGVSAGGDNFSGSPGDIHAYNVVTGKLEWVFHSIPHTGEAGAETWPADAYKWAGGVHNWNELTVDEKRGIVYIPFGTGRFDFVGANRKGNNLYGNSLVALDLKTGKKLWHYQLVHHDLWDYDLPQAPKLLTIKKNGKSIDVVAQATKHGFLFVFDRVTGKPVFPIEEKPVPQTDVPGEWTSPTQPYSLLPPFARQSFTEKYVNPYLSAEEQAAVKELLRNSRNDGLFTPPSLKGSIELPGHNGGANWGSSAVNPQTGMFFIFSKELPTLIKLIPPAPPGEAAAKGTGGAGKGKAAPSAPEPLTPSLPPPGSPGDFVRYAAPYDFMTQKNGLSPIGPPWSVLTAYDLNTGKIKWQIPNGTIPELNSPTPTGTHFARGGIIATSNGMLIVPTSQDHILRFYDQDTGKVLHEMQLPSASEGVGAVYEVDGREYIALTVAGGGGGMQAPKLTNGKAAPGGAPQYMVFALPAKR